MGVAPVIVHFGRIIPIKKPSILGTTIFRKPPNAAITCSNQHQEWYGRGTQRHVGPRTWVTSYRMGPPVMFVGL